MDKSNGDTRVFENDTINTMKVLLSIDFVNCGYNFGILGDAESSNESIRKKGEKGKCTLLHIQ